MHRRILSSSLALAALLAGAVTHAEPAKAIVSPDTGGSRKGDFGPPQGAPIKAVLTDAPAVPPAPKRKAPAKVVIDLEVKEVTKQIADGATYTFWTFGGSVPGKFMRVRQGDTVEFHLKNAPDSKMPHNIDLHAVTGPGGGAASSFTAPGHESQFTFKALNQGLYVYHCATAPVGMHIANGMYGLIYIEPPEGLPPVDREYYVMQGDFYTGGRYREKGEQSFDMQKAIDENPTYVVFNGADGALAGDHAITAKVGERVRLFIGNGGPNMVSSFHVIGEIFDRVFTEGGTRFQENVGTTLIPAGGSAIVEFTVEAPGNYVLVDHSIFRAFNKGAVGILKVEGPEKKDVYSGKQADTVYAPTTASVATEAKPLATGGKRTKADLMDEGKAVFATTCQACHQANAMGLPGVFPPLAKSNFLMADKQRSIKIVTGGLSGPVEVNGQTFNSVMPPLTTLTDDQVAAVLTFVRNSFGNSGDAVMPDEVKAARSQTASVQGEGH